MTSLVLLQDEYVFSFKDVHVSISLFLFCFTVVFSAMIFETITNQDLPVIKCILINHKNNDSSYPTVK